MDTNNQFYIFKEFLEDDDKIDYNKIKRLSEQEGLTNSEVKKIKEFTKIVKSMHTKAKSNIETYGDLLLDYQNILDKTNMLAKELMLTNSLEYSILFTYLIHSGYFSKDKVINCQTEGRKNILGLYQLDIMAGKGVCFNFSEMLKDFLNSSGFNSATIESNDTYKWPFLEKLLVKDSKPNHATNLILEKNKLYIYDSINDCIFKPENPNSATIISSIDSYKYKYIFLYKYKLHTLRSYLVNFNKKEIEVLNSLFTKDNYNSPYDKEYYNNIRKNCFELFNQNRYLLYDYRDSTNENINNIAKKLELIPNG